MIKTPEADILIKMRDLIKNLDDPLRDAMWGIYASADEYDVLMKGIPDSDGGITRMTDAIHNAHQEYIEVLESITDFDKHLAELIALRGKFTELTDIPMFSHIKENKRSPEREEYSV